MKKIISLSLAIIILFSVALCTPVIASVTYIDAVGEYTCETESVFVFKAPETGWYAIGSYNNIDPVLEVEFKDAATEVFDNLKNSAEFSAYLFLEEGEQINCKFDTYAEDEVVNFSIKKVEEAITTDYTAESGSVFYFTADHDDYYQFSSSNSGECDPYLVLQLPDGSYEAFDDENGYDFLGELYIKKGETVFFSVNDYGAADVNFKIDCDCSEYPLTGFATGVEYHVPSGTQFTFKAVLEGLYVFESIGDKDTYFEYTRNKMFTYSFDDTDYENNKLGFSATVYLTPGEEIRCFVSESNGEDVAFTYHRLSVCKHKAKKWVDYKSATAFDSGVKTQVCKECSYIFNYKAVPQLTPETPVARAVNTLGGVSVSWNKIDGAVKYAVYRRASGEKNWTRIKTTTSSTFLDKTAKNNTTYYYSARAFNVTGDYSVYDSVKTAKIKCVSTPELTKISNATTGIRVEWAKVTGATGYRVYRREDGVEYWTCIGTTKSLKYTDTSVKSKNGTVYTYTIRAVNGGDSGFDAEGLYTKRLSDPVMKSAVSGKTGVTVKWGAVNGAQSYYVYRKTANSSWVRLATVKGVNNVTFVDKTAKKGVTYTYTAKAVDGKNISAYSSTISCKDKY
ncbi:MAG: hypothetical protein IKT55_08405 [Clostridia bacterium]|nr:hypothetical protein [Clostridia bacterium]